MSISTLTSIDVCARVRARWVPGLPDHLRERVDHNLALCIPGGCERLARAVKDTTDRGMLTVEVQKAPAAGKLDLTHADFAAILIDTYKLPGAISANGLTFRHVPSLDALTAPTPKDATCVWFHIWGNRIVFKNPADNALDTFITPVTLRGSYIPDLGSNTRPMVGELNDQLVDRVYEVVKEMGGMSFLTLDPDKAAQVLKR